MDVILVFLLAAIGTWLIWWGMKFIQRYKTFCDIFKSNKVHTIGSCHPIWGHVHLVSIQFIKER